VTGALGSDTEFDEDKLISGPGASFVSLDQPRVLAASAASYLSSDALVMGLTVNNESRAYPVEMARYHHIINDTVGGQPIAATY
jgi:hypothetical protein